MPPSRSPAQGDTRTGVGQGITVAEVNGFSVSPLGGFLMSLDLAAWSKMWCSTPRSLPGPERAESILARARTLRPDTLMQTNTPANFTLADGADHTFFEGELFVREGSVRAGGGNC